MGGKTMFTVALFTKIGSEVIVQTQSWDSEQAFYDSLRRSVVLVVYLH